MIVIELAQTRNLKWNQNTKRNLISYLTPHRYAFGKSKLLKITFIVFLPGTCIGQTGEAVLALREPSCLVQVEGQLSRPLCSGPMVLPLISGS